MEATNARELSALRGPSQLFPAHDSDCGLSKVIDNLCPVVSHLELKAGAQVSKYNFNYDYNKYYLQLAVICEHLTHT